MTAEVLITKPRVGQRWTVAHYIWPIDAKTVIRADNPAVILLPEFLLEMLNDNSLNVGF
jgi:hypothetical protein